MEISDVGNETSSTVKSFGVSLHWKLTLDQHVANLCEACYLHRRALHHVRSSLPDDVELRLCTVDLELNYCNSLFAGRSATNFHEP